LCDLYNALPARHAALPDANSGTLEPLVPGSRVSATVLLAAIAWVNAGKAHPSLANAAITILIA